MTALTLACWISFDQAELDLSGAPSTCELLLLEWKQRLDACH